MVLELRRRGSNTGKTREITHDSAVVVVVSWLLSTQATGNVYPRNGSGQTIVHDATLGEKLKIKLAIQPSCSILTPDQLVKALIFFKKSLL